MGSNITVDFITADKHCCTNKCISILCQRHHELLAIMPTQIEQALCKNWGYDTIYNKTINN
jgi:hypothetical protein